jgi:hypothetical protein
MKTLENKMTGAAALAPGSGSAGRPCVSCGARAILSNYDGEYCKDCMQLHILEKMFVNLTAMQRPKTFSAAQPRTSPLETEGGAKEKSAPLCRRDSQTTDDVTRQPNASS